jgi:nitrogen fixation protein NifZ
MHPSVCHYARPMPSSMPEAAPKVAPAADNAGGETEIYGPPAFVPGQKVRALTAIRSDGTVPGADRGVFIVEAGDEGYVTGIGEFLQRYYIYRIDFIKSGRFVGMRRHEIALVED